MCTLLALIASPLYFPPLPHLFPPQFLREHYKGYPAPALTPGFVESSEQVERLLGVLCSQVGGADSECGKRRGACE